MKRFSGLLSLAILLSITGVRSFSQTIYAQVAPVSVYDSFGAGNSYNTQVSAGIWGASYGYNGVAFPFTPAVSGNLDTVELAVCQYKGSGRANFFVAQSNSQYPYPDTILESYLNVYCPGTFGQNNPPLVLTSGLQPLLQAGTMYFVCAEPADSTSVVAWNENNLGLNGLFATEGAPWSWGWSTEPTSAFQVTVIPVPEPATSALALAGLGLLLGNSRSKKLAQSSKNILPHQTFGAVLVFVLESAHFRRVKQAQGKKSQGSISANKTGSRVMF